MPTKLYPIHHSFTNADLFHAIESQFKSRRESIAVQTAAGNERLSSSIFDRVSDLVAQATSDDSNSGGAALIAIGRVEEGLAELSNAAAGPTKAECISAAASRLLKGPLKAALSSELSFLKREAERSATRIDSLEKDAAALNQENQRLR